MLQKLRSLFNRRNSTTYTKFSLYPGMSPQAWNVLHQQSTKAYKRQMKMYAAMIRLHSADSK